MPSDPLERKARRQLRSLVAWVRKADAVIDAKVADARGHLAVAVSDTLRRKPDGRPTLRHAVKSPSVGAAQARLDELLDALAGPSAVSLDGLLRDAREVFYREAFAEWKAIVPPELFVASDPEPTVANIGRARGLVIHGYDLRREVGGPVARSRAGIPPAVTLAGRRASTTKTSADVLATWERQSRDAIRRVCQVALSDSQVAADVIAGRDLIHPDHLDDSPIAVGA